MLGDAAYGDETEFRAGVSDLDLPYMLGIRSATTVWPPGLAPLPPKPWSGQGRPPTRLRRGPDHRPVAVKSLALSLPRRTWRTVTWCQRAADIPHFWALKIPHIGWSS